MPYDPIFADDRSEHRFRDRIQALLRAARPDAAEDEIRRALETMRAAGHPLAAPCLAADHQDIGVTGWDTLAHLGDAITAIGIDISWPGHTSARPDARGWLAPVIETNYFADDAFPFSTATRAEILAGYSAHGSRWQGAFDEIGTAIGITGIDHLHGAVYRLDAARQGPFAPSPDRDMAVIGACFVAVLVHRAIRATIVRRGLPRSFTVLVGSNESYPFFDAPVMTRDEYDALSPRPGWAPGARQEQERRQAREQPESAEAMRARIAAMTPQELEAVLNQGIDALPIRDERVRGIMRKAATLIASTALLR